MELPSSVCQEVKYVKSSVQCLTYTKSSINVNTSYLFIFLKSLLEPQFIAQGDKRFNEVNPTEGDEALKAFATT